ncbi:MAG: phosphopantetheine-binding protein [Bacteroides sp.]
MMITNSCNENLLKIVNTVLKNRSKTAISRITPDMNLREDIGLDSLDLAELTVRIEVEYDIDVLVTIGEILSKIQ